MSDVSSPPFANRHFTSLHVSPTVRPTDIIDEGEPAANAQNMRTAAITVFRNQKDARHMALVAKAQGTHEQENLLTVVRVWDVKHSDTRNCNKSAESTPSLCIGKTLHGAASVAARLERLTPSGSMQNVDDKQQPSFASSSCTCRTFSISRAASA